MDAIATTLLALAPGAAVAAVPPALLLAHISPALLEHVNPYGTYDFAVEAEYARTGYRALREPATETGA